MKNRIEKWILLPFSMGCASKSSVDVKATNCVKRLPPPACKDKETKNSSVVKAKASFRLFRFRKPSLARGIQRLIQSLRSATQIFSYRDEEDEFEPEMEIGFPTDVKHLLHIGRDGSTITNPSKSCNDSTAPEMIPLPPVSLKQFEMAMAAQTDGRDNQSQAEQPVLELEAIETSSSKLG